LGYSLIYSIKSPQKVLRAFLLEARNDQAVCTHQTQGIDDAVDLIFKKMLKLKPLSSNM
jgi:hypothetical protein